MHPRFKGATSLKGQFFNKRLLRWREKGTTQEGSGPGDERVRKTCQKKREKIKLWRIKGRGFITYKIVSEFIMNKSFDRIMYHVNSLLHVDHLSRPGRTHCSGLVHHSLTSLYHVGNTDEICSIAQSRHTNLVLINSPVPFQRKYSLYKWSLLSRICMYSASCLGELNSSTCMKLFGGATFL